MHTQRNAYSYESVVIYSFYELVIAYLGGPNHALRVMKAASPIRLGRRINVEPNEFAEPLLTHKYLM